MFVYVLRDPDSQG